MKYKVNWTLSHDCVNYPPGSEIELTDDEARRLTESGVIEPVLKPFSKKVPTSRVVEVTNNLGVDAKPDAEN